MGLGILGIAVVTFVVLLRLLGLLRPFNTPTGAMDPAVAEGDHIIMEGFTLLSRQPRQGDIVVFNTDDVPALPPGQVFVKRVVAGPGDHVRLVMGRLYVNEEEVMLSNAMGRIDFELPPAMEGHARYTDMVVPDGHYFVTGDNARNSNDSRFWGPLPARNILGHVRFRYWPPNRVGGVE